METLRICFRYATVVLIVQRCADSAVKGDQDWPERLDEYLEHNQPPITVDADGGTPMRQFALFTV